MTVPPDPADMLDPLRSACGEWLFYAMPASNAMSYALTSFNGTMPFCGSVLSIVLFGLFPSQLAMTLKKEVNGLQKGMYVTELRFSSAWRHKHDKMVMRT